MGEEAGAGLGCTMFFLFAALLALAWMADNRISEVHNQVNALDAKVEAIARKQP